MITLFSRHNGFWMKSVPLAERDLSVARKRARSWFRAGPAGHARSRSANGTYWLRLLAALDYASGEIMPVVTFLPAERCVTVATGTSLLDAATAAGVAITASCGGDGVCGECRVRIESGDVEQAPRGCLSPNELSQGRVLACSSRVVSDVRVAVDEEPTGSVAQIVTEDTGAHSPRKSVAGTVVAQPLATKHKLTVPAPSLDSPMSDQERLLRALRADGGPAHTVLCLDALRQLATTLRTDSHQVTATVVAGDATHPAEIIRVDPGDSAGLQLGLAIDIGTTTCVVRLVDLVHNRILGTEADQNRQSARGADVISRINYAKTPPRLDELRQQVLDTINPLIERLCERAGTEADQIGNVAVVGNTTMIHLLLGLNPDFIRLEPYTPTVDDPPRLRAGEVGLAANSAARVLFAPSAGSYVGGDITAGLLRTALCSESEEVRLFLDIGTNGEVVVGTGEWLMACAASAGPAFEGSGARCGMSAGSGAIERVRVDSQSGRATVGVIGGGRPRGVCGSGMIDLLAELWMSGLLDPGGKLNPDGNGVRQTGPGGRNLAYTVVDASESGTGEEIFIDERDIQELLRAKAAIYSACALLLKSVGLDFDVVTQVYIAGGFGRFLDLRRAIQIGLLPDLPLDRFTYLGNSALAGAQAMLTDADARQRVTQVASRITYLGLNVDPSYMSEYTAALFLPHTDIDRFPSVKNG